MAKNKVQKQKEAKERNLSHLLRYNIPHFLRYLPGGDFWDLGLVTEVAKDFLDEVMILKRKEAEFGFIRMLRERDESYVVNGPLDHLNYLLIAIPEATLPRHGPLSVAQLNYLEGLDYRTVEGIHRYLRTHLEPSCVTPLDDQLLRKHLQELKQFLTN